MEKKHKGDKIKKDGERKREVKHTYNACLLNLALADTKMYGYVRNAGSVKN